MDIDILIASEWRAIVTMMPADFEASARESGAIQRARKVGDAATLLRLALIYANSGGGLRLTAAVAAEQGIADISDVALLKRLVHASKWLSGLPSRMLADRRQYEPDRCRIARRLRLVDATTVSRPGSAGTDWRVHVGYSLSECRIDHVELTDVRGGETLKRIPVERGDILVADRGYSHANGISDVVSSGGDVLVRLNWNNLPLTSPDGTAFDILEHLRSIPVGPIAEWPVSTVAKPAQNVVAVQARLVAVRKSEAAAEVARSKLRKESSRKGHTPSAKSLEAASYTFLLTTVSADEMSAEQCLEIYRFRWQIELAFKNLKSVVGLSTMAAKSAELSTAFISAILVTAIIVDRMATATADFSPWGYATPWNLLLGAVQEVPA